MCNHLRTTLIAKVFLLTLVVQQAAVADELVRTADGLVVLYTFSSGEGGRIVDRSGVGEPLDLTIEKAGAVEWRDGSLRINSSASIRSAGSAKKIVKAVRRSDAVTIEAWVTPANDRQDGPARIVTMSGNTSLRNLTLGQDAGRFDVRLRTTATSKNGMPSTASDRKAVDTAPTHVVFTRDDRGTARLFVNAVQSATRKVGGKVTNWEDGFRLSLANEVTGDRPWLGELHLVAIYARPLSVGEVKQNFRAGPRAGLDPEVAARLARERSRQVFATRIAPLFARRCLACHDSASKEGGLDLSRKLAALTGGEHGKVLEPGRARESLIWKRVAENEMPPEGKPLSSDEKALLAGWIDDGAAWSIDFIDPAVFAGNVDSTRVWVRRLTVDEYIETVRAAVGVDIEKDARELLPPDLRADGFGNTSYNLTVDLKHVRAYAELARRIVKRMDVRTFARRFSKSRSLNPDGPGRELVAAIGGWLLRGPLDERELTNYGGILTTVASAGGEFEEGVSLMVEAMLQSPRFVYRMERQRGDGGTRRLGEFELASRASYVIWGAPPDEELFKAAREGRLSDSGQLRKQVERMLDDPRAVSRSLRFVSDWLHLDRLENLRPSPKRYPDWTPALGRDMRDETLAFFKEIAWKENRPLSDLFDAQFTYATPRLAKHYGLTPRGNGVQRYDLSRVPARGGLLTQGSILTIGGDDASMVTRGLFVLRDVLRGVIGDPPPGVDTTPIPSSPGSSLRTVAMRRIDSAACGGCHRRFEPLAFGLERYDGLGVYRLRDDYGNRLRTDGEVLFPGSAKPEEYSTSAELMSILADSDRVKQTVTWKLTQFALGRPLGAADALAVQRIHATATKQGGTYRALITAILTSDLIRTTHTQP